MKMSSLYSPFRQGILVLMLIGNATLVHAGEGESTDGEWEFTLAPLFLWMQGIEGSSTIGPVEAPLDITFKDALDNLDGTFTVHFEMKRDKLTLFAEYQYVDLGPETTGPMGVPIDIGFEDTIVELGAGYWLGGNENTDFELLAGGRWTEQKLDVSIAGVQDLLNVSEDWWVGFIGGRLTSALTDKWTFIARADYGLGSGDSNSILNMNVMVDYRFNDWGSVFVGYKYMDYDYDNGERGKNRYGYDASQQGPLMGLGIRW